MREIDRRTFIKLGAVTVVGVAAEEFLVPAMIKVDRAIEETTGQPAGNANLRQIIEKKCENSQSPQECFQNYRYSSEEKVAGIVFAPVVEEVLFRSIPSWIVSTSEGRKDPVGDVLTGTGGLKMTRREFFAGAVTSILYGAVHNITERGIDTKTIPSSNTIIGMVFWYLQRKLGIASNILAHALYNFKAFNLH